MSTTRRVVSVVLVIYAAPGAVSDGLWWNEVLTQRWAIVSVVLGVLLLTVDLWWPWINGSDTEHGVPTLTRNVQNELVAIIDRGQALAGDVITEFQYGSYTLWSEKTAVFLDKVFAPAEAQRFRERPDLSGRLDRLADLRDRPKTWEITTDERGLRRAIADRRWLTPAERIVTAGDRRWPLPRPDDRRELADDFDAVAAYVDDYLATRRAERPGIEARNVAAYMEAKAEENPSEEEVREKASHHSDLVDRTNYLLSMAPQVQPLFEKAVAEGVVSSRLRDDFLKPTDYAHLERLPHRLREVAERLREPGEEG